MAAAGEDEGRRRMWPRTWGPPPWSWGWSPGDDRAEQLPARVEELEELEVRLTALERYARWGTWGVWLLLGVTVGLGLASGEVGLAELLPILSGGG